MPHIVMQTSDEKIFKVDYKIMKCSTTIRQMYNNLGFEENNDEVIQLKQISSTIMEKILIWAEYHKDDPPYVENDEMEKNLNNICQFDKEFLDIDQSILFELLTAANFLHVEALMDTVCKTIAKMIVGKTPEQIRQVFNIENDLPPEEE